MSSGPSFLACQQAQGIRQALCGADQGIAADPDRELFFAPYLAAGRKGKKNIDSKSIPFVQNCFDGLTCRTDRINRRFERLSPYFVCSFRVRGETIARIGFLGKTVNDMGSFNFWMPLPAKVRSASPPGARLKCVGEKRPESPGVGLERLPFVVRPRPGFFGVYPHPSELGSDFRVAGAKIFGSRSWWDKTPLGGLE